METKNLQGKKLTGVVVSDKMDKTVVVTVSRYVKHPKYGKYMVRSKRYKAHDENNTFKEGDKVEIQETKPISKDKTFVVLHKVDTK
jgi:small subunit ribosomal protein S17